jgi:hypothetical protein
LESKLMVKFRMIFVASFAFDAYPFTHLVINHTVDCIHAVVLYSPCGTITQSSNELSWSFRTVIPYRTCGVFNSGPSGVQPVSSVV